MNETLTSFTTEVPPIHNNTDNENNYDKLALISAFIWWYVIVMAGVGLACNSLAVIYLTSNSNRCRYVASPCLLCISVGNSVFLATMLSCLLIAYAEPEASGVVICKVMIFTTNTASLFTNWCWVVLWGGRYLAVFRPWLYFRYYKHSNHYWTLAGLLLASITLESWTLVYATEVDRRCDLDPQFADYRSFKYVVLAESIISFFVPFLLILAANLRVLHRAYLGRRSTSLTQVLAGDISGPSATPTIAAGSSCQLDQQQQLLSPPPPANVIVVDRAMIVSSQYAERANQSRQRTIRRFVFAATVDLLLNFPNYILQLRETFARGGTDNDTDKDASLSAAPSLAYYGALAVSYLLFYSQYAFNLIYVYHLVKVDSSADIEQNQQKRTLMITASNAEDRQRSQLQKRRWRHRQQQQHKRKMALVMGHNHQTTKFECLITNADNGDGKITDNNNHHYHHSKNNRKYSIRLFSHLHHYSHHHHQHSNPHRENNNNIDNDSDKAINI